MRSVLTRIFVGSDGGEICCISGDLLIVKSTVGVLVFVVVWTILEGWCSLTDIFGTLRTVGESQTRSEEGLDLEGDLLKDGDNDTFGG